MLDHESIKQEKLLLVEGMDAKWFFIYALKANGIEGVQVINFGGIGEFKAKIRSLKEFDEFSNVKTLVICRDAETDPAAAFQSVIDSLRIAELPQSRCLSTLLWVLLRSR
ncbi:MAG: hypothetical protein HQK56_08685 [Deltaproteobacteria bacterium]|nr:hypothetical protein [Deltaproteobacteria bacterium]